ncbi:MAG: hypothetical protein ACKVU1_13250 [bacterium]
MKCSLVLRTPLTRALLLTVSLLFGISCASDSPNAPEIPAPPSGAAVAGFVYRVETGATAGAPGVAPLDAPHVTSRTVAGETFVIVDAPAAAPAGATPVADARLTIVDLDGFVVARGTADAAGAFQLGDLGAGWRALEVRVGASPGDLVATLEFTAIADATIALGRAHAVSREAAAALALAAVPDDALVLGTLQPLPAGTRVRPGRDGDASPRARTLAADAWLFFADLEPNARFDHAVEYIFVDAANGAVTRVTDATEPPAINGSAAWASDLAFVRYDGIDFESFDPDDMPAGASAALSSEIVRAPDGAARLSTRAGAGAAASARPASPPARIPRANLASAIAAATSSAPDDIFTIAVRGSSGSDIATDFANMSKLFESLAPNPANRMTMEYPAFTIEAAAVEYSRRINALRDRIEARLRAGGKPVLYYFVSSHGALEMDGSASGAFILEYVDGEKGTSGPGGTLLKRLRPCKIYALLDFCWAQTFADALIQLYTPDPVNERPELFAFAACDANETAKSYDTWQAYIPLFSRTPGGVFTNAIRGRMSLAPDGKLNGLQNPDGSLLTELATLTTPDGDQHPKLSTLAGDPNWCKRLLETSATSLDFRHNGITDPVPYAIGDLAIMSNSSVAVTWSVATGNAAIAAQPAAGTLAPGGTAKISFLYTGGAQSPFTTNIVFTASEGAGQRTEETTIPLTARIGEGFVEREFEIEAPLGPLSGRVYELFLRIPEGAIVESTELIDTTTGKPPAAVPWPAAPFVNYVLMYEGERGTTPREYGIRFRFENLTLESCTVCGRTPWRYRINYSFPRGPSVARND